MRSAAYNNGAKVPDMTQAFEPFLRWYITDRDEWIATAESLQEAADAIDANAERAKAAAALGRLGDHMRRHPNHAASAAEVLGFAVMLAILAKHPETEAANRVRLAIALQYADEHEEAVIEHEQAMELIETHHIHELLDYALQHHGKCLAEMGEYEQARQCFHRALEIRRERGDESLLASTREAIDELNRRAAGAS